MLVSSRGLWQRSWRKAITGTAKPHDVLAQHPGGINSIFITLFSLLLVGTTVNIDDTVHQIFSCSSSKVGMPGPHPLKHRYQLLGQLQTQGYVCTSLT